MPRFDPNEPSYAYPAEVQAYFRDTAKDLLSELRSGEPRWFRELKEEHMRYVTCKGKFLPYRRLESKVSAPRTVKALERIVEGGDRRSHPGSRSNENLHESCVRDMIYNRLLSEYCSANGVSEKARAVMSYLSKESFDPAAPLTGYPFHIQQHFRAFASYLLSDLRSNKQSVGLADAPDPKHSSHKVRFEQSSSPRWYSELFHEHSYVTKRKKRHLVEGWLRLESIIKRRAVEPALQRIADGLDERFIALDPENPGKASGQNQMRLRALIFRCLTEGFESSDGVFDPVPEVVRYFYGSGSPVQEELPF